MLRCEISSSIGAAAFELSMHTMSWSVAEQGWTTMRRYGSLPIVAFIMLLMIHTLALATTVTDLRCEHCANPLGLDMATPRLSWQIKADKRGAKQIAYQVLVASSPERLVREQGDLWDSGKVASDRSSNVEYAGKRLRSQIQCHWKVRTWDAQGNPSAWSEPAVWGMGLLTPEDWKAKWIAAPSQAGPQDAILLRKEITVPPGVQHALVHVCGLGHCELFLNGNKVGDRVLDPAWSNYRRSCYYVTDDITALLKPGVNTFAVMLGNGMYNLAGGRNVKFTPSFSGPQKVILQSDLSFVDGSSMRITTDNTWKVAAGPVTSTSAYGGEDYDARREHVGWMQSSYDDTRWTVAAEVDGPGGQMVSQKAPPVKVMQILKPVAVTEPQPGVLVFDLGQNISGWPQITVRGPAGATVKILPEELLDERGMVSQRFGPCLYSYTLKGAGEETWHPRFSYYGFRYLQVTGATRDAAANDKPVLLAIEGQWLHGSAPRAGEFSCSNVLLSQIHDLVNAAMRSNMQSLFTDCPHREKLGWLVVPGSMAFSRMYNFDLLTLYTKVVDDMREAQTDDGLIPDIAPEYTVFQGAFRDSPAWGSDYILVPWYMYQRYGDLQVLKNHYASMNRYMVYLGSKSQGNLLSHGLADWADVGPKYPYSHTPIPLVESAQYYCDAHIMAQIAVLLGKADDASRFEQLATAIKSAFNRGFFHADRNIYGEGTQTANAMPLALGMVGSDHDQAVLDNLLGNIRDRNQITSGCVGTRWLFRVIADRGYSDVLFNVFNNTDQPGYGYQIKQGATALTEAWDARRRDSWNHDMLGQIEEWFYHDLAGIQIDLHQTGSNRLTIKPAVVGDLTWVKAHYDSVLGRIESEWKREGDTVVMDVFIPANITATVYVPTGDPDPASVQEGGRPAKQAEGVRLLHLESDAVALEVDSGRYRFVTRISEQSY